MTAIVAIRNASETCIVVSADSLVGGDEYGNNPWIGQKLSILAGRIGVLSVGRGPDVHTEIRKMQFMTNCAGDVAQRLRDRFIGLPKELVFSICAAGFQHERAVILCVNFPSGAISEPLPVVVAHPSSNDAYSKLLELSQDPNIEANELCRRVHGLIVEAIELTPKTVGPPIVTYAITKDGAHPWMPD